jgi:hypothetical protein
MQMQERQVRLQETIGEVLLLQEPALHVSQLMKKKSRIARSDFQ